MGVRETASLGLHPTHVWVEVAGETYRYCAGCNARDHWPLARRSCSRGVRANFGGSSHKKKAIKQETE